MAIKKKTTVKAKTKDTKVTFKEFLLAIINSPKFTEGEAQDVVRVYFEDIFCGIEGAPLQVAVMGNCGDCNEPHYIFDINDKLVAYDNSGYYSPELKPVVLVTSPEYKLLSDIAKTCKLPAKSKVKPIRL